MKKYKFAKNTVNIKSDILGRMIEACIALPELTRDTVSKHAKVSLVTAGKLLNVMDECRFTEKVYKYPKNGRPYNLHIINKNLTSMIIDLSSADCSVSIIGGNKSCFFHKRYSFTAGISLFENITSSFSKACIEIRQTDLSVSAICVIFADEVESADVFNTHGSPTDKDKEQIKSAATQIFGAVPLLQMTLGEAISSAAKFNRLPTTSQTDTAYIYAGNDLKLCYIPKNGAAVSCRPKDLLVSDNATLADALEDTASPSDMAKILSRAVNLAHCAFAPKAYVIEYDVMKFGSKALHEIKKSFALLSRELPEIVVRDHRTGLAPLGAAAKASVEFIKLYISTTDKQKTSEDP